MIEKEKTTDNKNKLKKVDFKHYAALFSSNSVPNNDHALEPNHQNLTQLNKISDDDEDSQKLEIRKKHFIKYKRLKCCDCCKGKLAEKYKICKICETLYYLPMWCMLLTLTFYIGLFASSSYLIIKYVSDLQLQTYGGLCNTNLLCNTEKGLYCRAYNATSTDYCNCPAKSEANKCDCPSSYFWSGLACSPVYSYGDGPCVANYACAKGLTCNQYTGLCSCPDITPSWDSTLKSCGYAYKGCFNSCITEKNCDFYQSGVILITGDNSIYSIELDHCLNLCNLRGFKYAHMHNSPSNTTGMSGVSIHRCACSNTYNRYSLQLSDNDCNLLCSSFKSTVSSCPKSYRHSSFQIGA